MKETLEMKLTHTHTHTRKKETFQNAGKKKKGKENSRVYARNTTAVGDQRKRKSAPQKERSSDVFGKTEEKKKEKRKTIVLKQVPKVVV